MRIIIKKLFFLLFLIPITVYANDKIVFIDINYIFKNSNAGKDLHIQLNKKNEKLQLEVKEFKKQIEVERKKIISQKNVLSVEEYNKKITSLETKITEINSVVSEKQKEFVLFQKKIENNFSNSLNELLEEYSSQNSIDIILKRENLLMAKKDLDITQVIFKLFNDRINKIELK